MTARHEKLGWTDLAAHLRAVAVLFGQPSDLLEDQVLERREWVALCSWLRALEAIARALLLMMAAGSPRAAQASRRGARRPGRGRRERPLTDGAPAERASSEDIPPSERWAGVAFRCAPRAPQARVARRASEARSFYFTRALALAHRFEALIRVAERPEAYARRLARRLDARPALRARMLRAPRLAPGHAPPSDVKAALDVARRAVIAPDTG